MIKLDDGTYADRLEWGKFNQESLKKLAQNPKAAPLVEPYLEPSEEELAEAAKRTEIVIRTDYPKLERPTAKPGFIKSLFTSGVGLLGLFLIYAANIYAGYEVSIFRARSPGLICGVSAVLPILGPIIFLCMPTQVESKEDIVQEPAREREAYYVAGVEPADNLPAELAVVDDAAQLPRTKTFPRGQFTFNRRFFETQFPGFFGVVRQESDQDMTLLIDSTRGHHFEVARIVQLDANGVCIQVNTGGVPHEEAIPFLEIQQIILKHKDA